MLDRLPAFARHLMIGFFAAFMVTVLDAVISAKGVTGLSVNVLRDAFDYAAYSVALLASALYLTPLIKQYGLGKRK